MDEAEIMATLEELIRTSKNAAAKIAAIKELNRMREAQAGALARGQRGVQAPAGGSAPADAFAALDAVPEKRLRAV